ncbi:MAG: 6-bladed beta-propeller [Bacteroidales bacterium]|nr:6-bladed beta-propeller [Bacteroidales bacterium]MCF6342565.1 6-bladed beta-propeller [Bacteroidales bacterium]
MKKKLTLPARSCRFTFCLFLLVIVSGQGLFAQSSANNNGHLFSISDSLKSPLRLTIDKQGIVYVTDAFQKCITKYDGSGNYLETIYPGGSPVLVAVSNNNQLVVSDNNHGNLVTVNPNGKPNKIYSSCIYPSDAAFDGNNKLYVVDSKRKQVIVMDLSGNEIKIIGDGILVYPTGIAYDKKNSRILVAEHGGITSGKTANDLNTRVLAFDLQGNLLGTFGEFGYEDGQFTRIQGLAVDDWGRIYVVDNYQATISVFNEDGDFITRFSEFGNKPGQLNSPMDIAIDSRNRIWISSMNTGSLEVFSAREIGLDGSGEILPVNSELLQNYPNPFRDGTWIPFILADDQEVTINIYNVKGTLVRTFEAGLRIKGKYTENGRAVFWDGNNADGQAAGNGIYFYELKLNNLRKVRRMVLLN